MPAHTRCEFVGMTNDAEPLAQYILYWGPADPHPTTAPSTAHAEAVEVARQDRGEEYNPANLVDFRL